MAGPVPSVSNPSPPTNLSPIATRFVGRSDELRQIEELFATGCQLVTLWGPGGIGKTRIAAHHGLGALHRYAPGGVWFCELRSARRGNDLLSVIGGVLEVPLLSGKTLADGRRQLGRALAARGRCLLILDNLEQIVGPAADAVDAWRSAAPKARFLTTSRQPLQLPGEALIELLPLATRGERSAAARELLLERAREANPMLRLALDSPVLAEIVRHMEGIPLAIELAAARMGLLTPQQVLDHLGDRMRLLARPLRKPSSPGALRETIAWSWDLLDASERAVLAQLSVFVGGFSLESAEAILRSGGRRTPSRGPWAIDVIQALRQKSLLQVQGFAADRPRYSLFESVRAFIALKSAPAAEVRTARERHALHFLESAERWATGLDGTESREALAWMASERDNCNAALDHLSRRSNPALLLRMCLAVQAFLHLTGPASAHLAVMNLGVNAAARAPRSQNGIGVLATRAIALSSCGQPRRALVDLNIALRAARQKGDRALISRILLGIAFVQRTLGPLGASQRSFGVAYRASRSIGDQSILALVLIGRAGVTHLQRKLERARGQYEEGINLTASLGNLRWQGVGLVAMAFLHQDRGDLPLARTTLGLAASIAERLQDRRLEGRVLGYTGNLLREEGKWAEAEARYQEAMRVLAEVGDRTYEATFLMDLGILHTLRRELTRGRQVLREVVEMSLEMGLAYVAAVALGYLGALEADLGDDRSARACFVQATRQGRIALDPAIERALSVHRLHLHLSQRSESLRSSLEPQFRRLRAEPQTSLHVRLATRLLRAALDEVDPPEEALVLWPSGIRLRLPGGRELWLRTRTPLARLMVALAEQRRERPQEPMNTALLFERGWPGEKLSAGVAVNRLRVAIATLRKLGLRNAIVWDRTGYRLDTPVVVGRDNAASGKVASAERSNR